MITTYNLYLYCPVIWVMKPEININFQYRAAPLTHYHPETSIETMLYGPIALFTMQLLPYQYFQIVRGVFLLPSAFSIYNLFLPENPFKESQYGQGEFKQAVFEEKGEYTR